MNLAKIQALVKAPKGQFNNFGKYKYRSCEDIVEAIKPVINPLGFALTLSDEVVLIGQRFYIKATATLTDGKETYTATAFAREEEVKKGMDGSQITGASSSYARKYALNGLFAIDDTKDADSTNTGKEELKTASNNNFMEKIYRGLDKEAISDTERDYLNELLEKSTYEEEMRKKMWIRLNEINTIEDYEKAKANLLMNQVGFDGVQNPSKKDINRHLKNTVK